MFVGGTQGGVNPGTGERPFRQEIGKLQASGPAWDLYILALQRFQQSDQAQQLSYYQVAGMFVQLQRAIFCGTSPINMKQESTGRFEDLKSPAPSINLQADILTYRGMV